MLKKWDEGNDISIVVMLCMTGGSSREQLVVADAFSRPLGSGNRMPRTWYVRGFEGVGSCRDGVGLVLKTNSFGEPGEGLRVSRKSLGWS